MSLIHSQKHAQKENEKRRRKSNWTREKFRVWTRSVVLCQLEWNSVSLSSSVLSSFSSVYSLLTRWLCIKRMVNLSTEQSEIDTKMRLCTDTDTRNSRRCTSNETMKRLKCTEAIYACDCNLIAHTKENRLEFSLWCTTKLNFAKPSDQLCKQKHFNYVW